MHRLIAVCCVTLAGVPAVHGQITLPPFYRAVVYRSQDLNSGLTAVTVDPQGRVFAAQADGRILRLPDDDHDGVSDGEPAVLYHQLDGGVFGLAFLGPALFASNVDRIVRLQDTDGDGAADVETTLVAGLPIGAHWVNGLAFGPDGRLYFALGSDCDLCPQAHPYSATVMRCLADGSQLEVFARGVRNCYDLAFHPAGDLIGGDNQHNTNATPTTPVDELNHYRPGADYGYPAQAGTPPPGTGTTAPVIEMPAHSSPNGILFYRGRQFPGMRGQGLITLYGAFGAPATPQPVLQLNLQPDGLGSYTAGPQPFAGGFHHPLDLAEDTSGDLYVACYVNGPNLSLLYRISFEDLAIGGDTSRGGQAEFRMRGTAGELFLIMVSLGTAHVPLGPQGILRIDPATRFYWPIGAIPPGDELLVAVTIPDDALLVGLDFHHQMLRLTGSGFYFGVRATLSVTP